MRVLLNIIILCVTICGCVSNNNAGSSKTEQGKNNIVHVVLIWLHEPGNTEHIEKIIQVSEKLKEIPDIQELHVGSSIPSDREIVDDSFDVGLTIIFNSESDLQHYLAHTKHKHTVKKVISPLSRKILVYDFKSDG